MEIIYSSTDGLRNCFILQRAVRGILFSSIEKLREFFYSSTNLCLRKLWCVELNFLILLIVFIHEVCDKMSNRNIHDPNEHNWEFLSRLWDAMKWRGDGKCYCPCTQCMGFKRRIIKITTTRKHCREHGHAEGGMNIVHL